MTILTGIQPSGKLHLGNYFGAMRPMISLQEQGEEFFFIADYHALTTVRDPQFLRESVRDVALDFLACGLDPSRTVFYRQSDVPEVQELAWLLSVITPMGLIERCHSYKDKLAHGKPATHGLFTYPVLMAADILLMQAEKVPVGKDQKQHLEVTRDIAIKFNNAYGEIFKIPDALIAENVAVILGTDGQKMSKSYGNTIGLFDDLKRIRKQIMGIKTDCAAVEDPKDPDASSIYGLYKLFATPEEAAAMAARFRAGGMGYGEAKKALFEIYERTFAPFREKRAALEKDPDYVADVLKDGARRARERASDTLHRARAAVGLE